MDTPKKIGLARPWRWARRPTGEATRWPRACCRVVLIRGGINGPPAGLRTLQSYRVFVGCGWAGGGSAACSSNQPPPRSTQHRAPDIDETTSRPPGTSRTVMSAPQKCSRRASGRPRYSGAVGACSRVTDDIQRRQWTRCAASCAGAPASWLDGRARSQSLDGPFLRPRA